MKSHQRARACVVLSFAGLFATAAAAVAFAANGQRFHHSRSTSPENPAVTAQDRFTEALTGFDSTTNGFLQQGPVYSTLNEDNVVSPASNMQPQRNSCAPRRSGHSERATG
jgi:hypothetical protein